MNILIYSHSWFPKVDGVTIRYKNIIDYLKKDNNVHLITPDINGEKEHYPGIKTKIIKGMQLPIMCRDDNPEVIIPDLKHSFQIFNEINEYCILNSIDIIHVSSPDLILSIFQLISIINNIPIISIYHTDIMEYSKVSKKPISLQYFAWMMHIINTYGLLDCLGTTSPLMASKIRNYNFYFSKNPIWILPPSINTKLFKPSSKRYEPVWTTNKIKLLYVGRITAEKSIDRILNIMDNNMSLVLIGYGGAIDVLKSIAFENNLDVKFFETMNQSELPYWYSSCDIFIMPSSTETLGFVTLEAMSSGAAVCGYSAGGTLDIIENNINGLLFKNDDELKSNIYRLYENDSFRENIIKKGLEFSSNLSIESSVDKLKEKYEDLIQNKSLVINDNFGNNLFNIFCRGLLNTLIFVNKIIHYMF